MRKLNKIAMVAVLVFGVFFVTGCGDKKAITAEEFKTTMEELEYSIIDATSELEEGSVDSVQVAKMGEKYSIEFYVVSTNDQAISAYNQNKTTFEDSKESSSTSSSISIGNNSKYTLSTGDNYKVISRIDNTFIYVNANKAYKTEINKALKKLGY